MLMGRDDYYMEYHVWDEYHRQYLGWEAKDRQGRDVGVVVYKDGRGLLTIFEGSGRCQASKWL